MKLLFTSGTARGGTNFRTLMLNNHPNIRMSLDPFIPLFRYYRYSLLKSQGAEELLNQLPSGVLDDYYFSNTKRQLLQKVQNSNPDIAFDSSNWEELKANIAGRMKLASVDLIPYLDKLPARTFKEVFSNTMKVIASTTDKELKWVGFNDNWTMEFFPLVSKLIPDAKFMLHLRDPRAVINSSEFAEPDPAKRPTIVSFARHLRKYFAFAHMLPTYPQLKDRLLITYYEPFINDPEGEVRKMTEFLDVEYFSEMIDVGKFRKADGKFWPSDWAIYKTSTDIWKKEMPKDMAELSEFICDPEMRLHGYKPEIYDPKVGLSDSAFSFAIKNNRSCLGWRTDFQEIERTIGSELFRKKMIQIASEYSPEEVERNFLFPEVFENLNKIEKKYN
jgi:hypothetical protein